MIMLSLFRAGFAGRVAIRSLGTELLMTTIAAFVLRKLEFAKPCFAALETMSPSFISALLVGYIVAIIWSDSLLKDDFAQELAEIGIQTAVASTAQPKVAETSSQLLVSAAAGNRTR
jgi:hypothetical protein